MRALIFICGFCVASALSVSAIAQSSEEDGVRFVISELEGLKGLQLRDCIAGYDAALYQAQNSQNSSLNVEYTKGVIGYMRQALDQKEGRSVSIEEVRLNSSFHVSRLYLSGGSPAHLAYQGAIIDSCNAQIGQIAKRAAERKGQL